jgi:glutaredoxin
MPKELLLVLLATLLVVPSLTGCRDGDGQHYARALAIERELLRQDPDAGYDHRRYLHVMRQLSRVAARSPDRERADRLMGRISDARRIALLAIYPEQVDHLPSRLQGKAAPTPPTTNFSSLPAAPKAAPPQAGPGGPGAAAATPGEVIDGPLQIVMYSTAWCGYCRKARLWFKDNGFPFVEKDIEKSQEAQREYQQASGGYGGVPLIVVNGQSFRGFDQRALLRRIRAVLDGA